MWSCPIQRAMEGVHRLCAYRVRRNCTAGERDHTAWAPPKQKHTPEILKPWMTSQDVCFFSSNREAICLEWWLQTCTVENEITPSPHITSPVFGSTLFPSFKAHAQQVLGFTVLIVSHSPRHVKYHWIMVYNQVITFHIHLL